MKYVAAMATETLGVLASHESYRQHLRPIAAAVSSTQQLVWLEAQRLLRDVHADVWLTASVRDFLAVKDMAGVKVFTEHGCGLQTYGLHQLKQIARADVIAVPNEFTAQRYRPLGTKARIEVVGTPKMDALLQAPHRSDGRTVAVSFHWSGVRTVPAAYRDALSDLSTHVKVLGHGHPRSLERLEPFYYDLGIETVSDFAEVVERADVLACDHSSVIYEWCALDRPVVLLRRPSRMIANLTGLRYTDHAEVGPLAAPEDLAEVAEVALGGDPEHQAQRQAATEALFPHLGQATARMVELLTSL